MGKNNRHQKNIKLEKAKVKLKMKNTKNNLPKGLNVTDTSFKVKKIVIREQLKHHDKTEILCCRNKLNIKDLLTRLQHYNLTVRQDAVRELREMLSRNSTEILSLQLRPLLQGISALSLDREKDIRRDSMKVLNSILGSISNDQLRPFADLLVSYLCCSMTHIDPNIKEDSLFFLDVLAQNCGSLLAKNARKVLPNFLDMISRLKSESNPGRQLVTTLSSKNTSSTWRTKVLERLSSMLSSIVNEHRPRKLKNHRSEGKYVIVDSKNCYPSIYNNNALNLCRIDFDDDHCVESNNDLEDFMSYTKVLMPLMFDSWLEVIPKENSKTCDPTISQEAFVLLKSIANVVQSVIGYFELLEAENDCCNYGEWLRDNFLYLLGKNLLGKFPYAQMGVVQKPRKRQEDFQRLESNDRCLEENFSLCYAYVWILTADRTNTIEDSTSRDICARIFNFVNERLANWSSNDVSAIPQLVKLLRAIFLRASKIFYKSGINLRENLCSIIEAYSRTPRSELQAQLFTILTEIILDRELRELHDEKAFRDFIISLPSLLLKNTIHENTIRMLNQISLQYGRWIRDDLTSKHKEIIENTKKIEIIGSDDEKRSRLTIYNLFYFVDEQIYY